MIILKFGQDTNSTNIYKSTIITCRNEHYRSLDDVRVHCLRFSLVTKVTVSESEDLALKMFAVSERIKFAREVIVAAPHKDGIERTLQKWS